LSFQFFSHFIFQNQKSPRKKKFRSKKKSNFEIPKTNHMDANELALRNIIQMASNEPIEVRNLGRALGKFSKSAMGIVRTLSVLNEAVAVATTDINSFTDRFEKITGIRPDVVQDETNAFVYLLSIPKEHQLGGVIPHSPSDIFTICHDEGKIAKPRK
jgi:hypothetical protein